MIQFDFARTDDDFRQILALQKANLKQRISSEEAKQEGFVTVDHTFEVLQKMNSPHPHIVARDGDKIVAYALVMLSQMATEIPILFGMFEQINSTPYKNAYLKDLNYFVMGQICIAKEYRGQGVFQGLYQKLDEAMKNHFAYIITLISLHNPRSCKAHQKVGFEIIKNYQTDYGDDVIIVMKKTE